MSVISAAKGEPTPHEQVRAGATADRHRPRRAPVLEIVAALVALGVLGVAGTAFYRQFTGAHRPVLPTSWCRVGMVDNLPPLLGSALFTKWQLDPIALAVLAALGVWYLGAVVSARRLGTAWSIRYTACFFGGLAICGLATNSSIAVYDMALFSAHMIGHLLLVMAAPILLCAGQPLTLLLAASSRTWRSRLDRALHSGPVTLFFCPPVALATYAAAIVGTHLTGLMNQVMLRPWAGQLEHLVYVVVGCQFFMLITAGDPPIRWHLTTPTRWLLLVLSMAVDTFTGVVLLFNTQPIAMTPVAGLSVNRLSDTETGGAIMWVGGDGLMALVMIFLVRVWLRSPALRNRDRAGFMEQARRSTFAAHTGAQAPESDADSFDEDDAKLRSYNDWLARINHTGR